MSALVIGHFRRESHVRFTPKADIPRGNYRR
jgi:hypothetical protein